LFLSTTILFFSAEIFFAFLIKKYRKEWKSVLE
jgi:hypothetical protein